MEGGGDGGSLIVRSRFGARALLVVGLVTGSLQSTAALGLFEISFLYLTSILKIDTYGSDGVLLSGSAPNGGSNNASSGTTTSGVSDDNRGRAGSRNGRNRGA